MRDAICARAGHGDSRWLTAVVEQAKVLTHTSNLFHTVPQVLLSPTAVSRTLSSYPSMSKTPVATAALHPWVCSPSSLPENGRHCSAPNADVHCSAAA